MVSWQLPVCGSSSSSTTDDGRTRSRTGPKDRDARAPADPSPAIEPNRYGDPDYLENIKQSTGFVWDSIDEVSAWYDDIQKEIDTYNMGHVITLDTSTGFIELPGGYEWNLPGHGTQPGPVQLNDRSMFRYTSKGYEDRSAEGASGSYNIILFGKRLGGDGERVIARMQGFSNVPYTLYPRAAPSEVEIKEKVSEYIRDTVWHHRVQQLGLAGENYATVIMPWKSSPIDANNIPSMLQISRAQQMDLEQYMKLSKTTEAQGVRAFEMFAERYLRLLENGLAQIDAKPGNIGVNVDPISGDVTQLLFIDIDDEFACPVDPKNKDQVTVYWMVAVIQSLCELSAHWSSRSSGMMNRMLTEFVRRHPWMNTSWESIRNFKKGRAQKPNKIVLLLTSLLEDPSNLFAVGKTKTLAEMLQTYCDLDADGDSGEEQLEKAVREARNVAAAAPVHWNARKTEVMLGLAARIGAVNH